MLTTWFVGDFLDNATAESAPLLQKMHRDGNALDGNANYYAS